MASTHGDNAARVAAGIQGLLREATALAASLGETAGLHPGDGRGLRALDLLAEGPLTPGELGRLLDLSSAATTGLVDRLEASGLARRGPHPTDRRRVQVELTEQARRYGAEHLRPIQRRLQSALAGASDAELAAVARFLSRLADG
jgi:DNA-binding MarR family transcriptional regulator